MFATSIDLLMYVVVAFTTALLVYKAVHLYGGSRLLKQATPAELAGLDGSPASREVAVAARLEQLEQGMAILATIAAAAPFIGLMGTVLHIMTALSQLSGAALDIRLISGPIATALHSTLVGLASAVPAAIGYNLFSRRLQVLENRARRVLALAKEQAEHKGADA